MPNRRPLAERELPSTYSQEYLNVPIQGNNLVGPEAPGTVVNVWDTPGEIGPSPFAGGINTTAYESEPDLPPYEEEPYEPDPEPDFEPDPDPEEEPRITQEHIDQMHAAFSRMAGRGHSRYNWANHSWLRQPDRRLETITDVIRRLHREQAFYLEHAEELPSW